jgi:hypothetical protein
MAPSIQQGDHVLGDLAFFQKHPKHPVPKQAFQGPGIDWGGHGEQYIQAPAGEAFFYTLVLAGFLSLQNSLHQSGVKTDAYNFADHQMYNHQ